MFRAKVRNSEKRSSMENEKEIIEASAIVDEMSR